MVLPDSGNRREFETGAVRDIAEGKGRCDLLPLITVGETFFNENREAYRVLYLIDAFIRGGERKMLHEVIRNFSEDHFSSTTEAILEVSKHYEDGAQKYNERNWEMGIPLHCFIDSAVRHYLKFVRGDADERHDRAFLWNLLGALWTMDNHPELCDLPFIKKEEK